MSAPALENTPNESNTAQAMRLVLLAMVPGILASIWFLGLGVLSNLALAGIFCLLFEALALRWRAQAFSALRDGSALVTAALLALALPPFASIWLIILGAASAILLAKHAYGGYGNNVFNPAIAGYALLLVLYPAQLAHWPAPNHFDGITGATALDLFKQNNSELVADWWRGHAQFGRFGGYGWEWINAAFLGGGLYLLQRKLFSWHAPICALAAIGVMALLFYDGGSSASGGSPLMHWFSGGTMLGVFFVLTEPVTAPENGLGRAICGALIGILIFSIRHYGHYADGIAFAVLFGNAITPLLDRTLIKLHAPRAIADE